MGDIVSRFYDLVHDATGLSSKVQEGLLETVVTILALWAARAVLLRLVARRVDKTKDEDEEANLRFYQWRQGSRYVTYALAFLLVGRIWIESFESLATVVGLVSAGLAVALKDPLLNVAGWLFIVWRKPFEIGDRISLGDRSGDVVGQGMFTFSLMEIGMWVDADDRTGRVLVVPNGLVFTNVVANYSKGWFEHIWNELAVTVTFESHWRDAKELMTEIAARNGRAPSAEDQVKASHIKQEYLVLSTNLTPRVFVSIADVGVCLTLRYVCLPFDRRRSAEIIWEDILDAFAAREDIDFAYPTIRYYDNVVEGKADARATPLG